MRLELKSAFVYEGKLQPDGNTIEGNWIQGDSTRLVMKRVDKIPELNRPQTPKKPYPYTEEEVVYKNPAADVSIAGTLTLPKGKGPFPAVLLIAGSGPSDRDEAALGHKPFLVLADHLTRQGIAVLRADKRGVGKTTGTFRNSGVEEFASDALAGVKYLTSRTEVDARRIGLIGHSEGGGVAPWSRFKRARSRTSSSWRRRVCRPMTSWCCRTGPRPRRAAAPTKKSPSSAASADGSTPWYCGRRTTPRSSGRRTRSMPR